MNPQDITRMTRLSLGGSGRGQSHSVYFDDESRLVVEWHEHSENAPYEHATMILFGEVEQQVLAKAMNLPETCRAGGALLAAIQKTFDSYFEVKAFAEEHRVPNGRHVDFWP
jgi:hypothetical protein